MTKVRILTVVMVVTAVCTQTASAKTAVSGYVKLPVVQVTQEKHDEFMATLKGRPFLDLGEVADPLERSTSAQRRRRVVCEALSPAECKLVIEIDAPYGCMVCVKR